MTSRFLITGGSGYIGSHMALALMDAGHHAVLLDNLSNSSIRVLDRLRQLHPNGFEFVQADIRDDRLEEVFRRHPVDGVIHFAGLKSVGESRIQPLRYFDHNIAGTLRLLRAMDGAGVRRIVFSSSATVYEATQPSPLAETAALGTSTPYGHSKLACEDMLRSLQAADPRWQVAILRYFNPVGAHPSGLIGEAPQGLPSNLMPMLTQVASGRYPHLSVFGNDYPTPDGTGIRDYIHVMDLAEGHLAALAHLTEHARHLTLNLGTGHGTSVRELIDTFARVTGRDIPVRIADRRPGDIAVSFADPSLAWKQLRWKATRNLETMCADAWRWQSLNPEGYGG